jgi:hypothetical protein
MLYTFVRKKYFFRQNLELKEIYRLMIDEEEAKGPAAANTTRTLCTFTTSHICLQEAFSFSCVLYML